MPIDTDIPPHSPPAGRVTGGDARNAMRSFFQQPARPLEWTVTLWEPEALGTIRLLVFNSAGLTLHCDVRDEQAGVDKARVHEVVGLIALGKRVAGCMGTFVKFLFV